MTSDKTAHTSSRQPNYGIAAVGFFLVAALKRDMAPWFILITGINMMNGCLLGRRFRKAAAQQVAAAGDRPQEGDRG
jgi:hypothetical protein